MNRSERLQHEHAQRIQSCGLDQKDSACEFKQEAYSGKKRKSGSWLVAVSAIVIVVAMIGAWVFRDKALGGCAQSRTSERCVALKKMWNAQDNCKKLRTVGAESDKRLEKQWLDAETSYRKGVVALEKGNYAESAENFARVDRIVHEIAANGIVTRDLEDLKSEAYRSFLKVAVKWLKQGTVKSYEDVETLPDDAVVEIPGMEALEWYYQGEEDYNQWRFKDAERCFRRALELTKSIDETR